MVKQERKAAEESNQDSTLFKVHSFNLTANGLVDFAGGILHSAFIKGNERQLNDPAMRNKTMRTLIEMARAENEDVVAVKKLTKQFNDFEKTGDAQAFIDFLQTEQDIPYRQHILDTLQGKSLAKISKDLQLNKETTSKSQPLKDVLISLLTGKNSNGKKLSRSSEMALHTFLDRQINVDSDAGCKSGQDRTLHLFAMSLASKALEKEFGLDCTAKFLQNFDALAKTYDTAQNPSALRKMFSSAKTREKSFEAMAKEFGLSKEKAQQMMETYRQNYYKAAIETGLPMTQYSTLLPGLKWHNEKGGLKGYLAENRLPINYMPQQITLDDGSTVPIMKHGAFGRRIFTPEGIALVKGLARYRDT